MLSDWFCVALSNILPKCEKVSQHHCHFLALSFLRLKRTLSFISFAGCCVNKPKSTSKHVVVSLLVHIFSIPLSFSSWLSHAHYWNTQQNSQRTTHLAFEFFGSVRNAKAINHQCYEIQTKCSLLMRTWKQKIRLWAVVYFPLRCSCLLCFERKRLF